MMKKRASSNSDVLTFLEVPEFLSFNLAVPDFTVVENSHFALVVVNLEKLNDFALKIKVVESFNFFLINTVASGRDGFKRTQVLS